MVEVLAEEGTVTLKGVVVVEERVSKRFLLLRRPSRPRRTVLMTGVSFVDRVAV